MLATVLLLIGLAEVVIAVVAGVASGHGWADLLNHFVVTNMVIGASLSLAGWPIGWQRPTNPIGWLLLSAGVLYAGSAAAFSLLAWGSQPGEQRPVWRLIGTWANMSWPVAIAVCIPLALLMFPNGRLLSPRWRWLLIVAAINGPVFVATNAFSRGQPGRDLAGSGLSGLATF